jgi:hypothetical protein
VKFFHPFSFQQAIEGRWNKWNNVARGVVHFDLLVQKVLAFHNNNNNNNNKSGAVVSHSKLMSVIMRVALIPQKAKTFATFLAAFLV